MPPIVQSIAAPFLMRQLVIGFIVNSDQPFGIFDDCFLQNILQQFDDSLFKQIAWSKTSLRKEIDTFFEKSKARVRLSLREAISKIHLTFDLWTSPNRYAILAISGHFLDTDRSQQQCLLALSRQIGCHSGQNIAHTIRKVVADWNIEDKISTLVSDNASNNDTCIESFFCTLNPSFDTTDAEERRMRYYSHILNLVGHTFLFGTDEESIEEEIGRAHV